MTCLQNPSAEQSMRFAGRGRDVLLWYLLAYYIQILWKLGYITYRDFLQDSLLDILIIEGQIFYETPKQ